MQETKNGATLGFEEKLWQAADKQEQAVKTVMEQAELMCGNEVENETEYP